MILCDYGRNQRIVTRSQKEGIKMAKLKAPLLSMEARGQLGKTMVFFPWKGINAVREYVTPSNPKTTLQTTQRGYVSDAADTIHVVQAQSSNPLDADDQSALSLLARVLGKTMTWWNTAVKMWVDVAVAGKESIVYSDGTTTDPAHDGSQMTIYIKESTGSTLAAGKFYLGTTPSNLNQSKAGVVSAGVSVTNSGAKFTTLTAGVKYYWQFRPDSGDGCEGANSGIYYFVAT
jgi:hypothetical protein